MLHIDVSHDMSTRIEAHLSDKHRYSFQELRWNAHLIETFDGPFVLVMEEASRYCIIFHRLSEYDFRRFPRILQDRLCREVIGLCGEASGDEMKLRRLVQLFTQGVQFRVGIERSASMVLLDLIKQLNQELEDLGGYPIPGMSELQLAQKLNRTVRESKIYQKSVEPRECFRDFWLRKLASPIASCK